MKATLAAAGRLRLPAPAASADPAIDGSATVKDEGKEAA
jgi:hypothetical protein